MIARTQTWSIRTPEGVSFSFRIASPLLRVAALLIDFCVVGAAWSLFSGILMLFAILGTDFMGAANVIAWFVLSQGYRIWAEWAWGGRTLGKRVMRLRVMDERGFRLSFAQIVMRNLLRFVDVLPAAYCVGGVMSWFNARGQRLGDLAAGTIVVWEAPAPKPNLALLRGEKHNSLRSHQPIIARLRQSISSETATAAWQAVTRGDKLDPNSRQEIFAVIAAHFRSLTPIPSDLSEGISDEQFVKNVLDVVFLNR